MGQNGHSSPIVSHSKNNLSEVLNRDLLGDTLYEQGISLPKQESINRALPLSKLTISKRSKKRSKHGILKGSYALVGQQ